MIEINKHLLPITATIKEALSKLNTLTGKLTLFVIDNERKVLGTITDGDIRRALLIDNDLTKGISSIMNDHFYFFREDERDTAKVRELRNKRIYLLPILDRMDRIVSVIDIEDYYPVLPITVMIMAGGEGRRLRPFTENIPKPMLPVSDKPILEHNIDRLAKFGVTDIFISVKYLGDAIKNYFGDGTQKNLCIRYIEEDIPLGTIGALSKLKAHELANDAILIMNSDILTNIDFEDFYEDFKQSGVDMSIACVSYDVNIPYAVIETKDKFVTDLSEKPTINYLTNGGIYLIRHAVLQKIPENLFFNATDLIHKLIADHSSIRSYKLLSYWLDIGKHEDYKKAQDDFKHIKF